MLYLFQVDVISLWMFDEYLFLLKSCLSANAVSRFLRVSCLLSWIHSKIFMWRDYIDPETTSFLKYNWSNRWHCTIATFMSNASLLQLKIRLIVFRQISCADTFRQNTVWNNATGFQLSTHKAGAHNVRNTQNWYWNISATCPLRFVSLAYHILLHAPLSDMQRDIVLVNMLP